MSDKVNWKDRIGEKKLMKCGMIAEIIEATCWEGIIVKFEDGYIKNSNYGNFKTGAILNPNAKSRLGEININNQGLKMKIIKYNGCMDIDVEFEDGYITYNTRYSLFKKGSIKSHYFPESFGVGYIGNTISSDGYGKPLKSYVCWRGMLARCYDEETQRKHPTYKDCKVCDEWLCYANFKEWYDKHYYELDNERMELDKDILLEGNRIYSPETCIFVPQKINAMFREFNNKNNDLPKGVYEFKDRYTSNIKIDRKTKCLGYYDTIEEAENVYLIAKREEINKIAEEYKDKIPKKLYNKLKIYSQDGRRLK